MSVIIINLFIPHFGERHFLNSVSLGMITFHYITSFTVALRSH
jgi:hypothetical protein